MPERCEVVEVRNLADAVGYSCSRTASTQCSDCGIELCEPHAETCGACHSVFCLPCFFCHQAQHSKPVSVVHGRDRERKSALARVLLGTPSNFLNSDCGWSL